MRAGSVRAIARSMMEYLTGKRRVMSTRAGVAGGVTASPEKWPPLPKPQGAVAEAARKRRRYRRKLRKMAARAMRRG